MKDSKLLYENLTVLIIEDMKVIQDIHVEFLKDMGFIKIDTADDAEQAILRFRQMKHYDLVITDYDLGKKISGLDLFKIVKDEYGLKIPFLIVTSQAHDKNLVEKCSNYHVDALIAKPLNKNILQSTIEKIMLKKQ